MKSNRLYRMGYRQMAAPTLNEVMIRKEENDEENYFVKSDDSSSDDSTNDVGGNAESVNTDQAVGDSDNLGDDAGGLGLEGNHWRSVQSSSTATRTAANSEIQTLPLHLPNFKPAADCIDASFFTVKLFLIRMKTGITVMKHGRSRWSKSLKRVLKIRKDKTKDKSEDKSELKSEGICNLFLTWEPAQDEPRRRTKRRPPRLDLTTCREVRHARSEDPDHKMYTGTPILRKKCATDKIRKSFSLIFPERTVDITSETEDQCRLLTAGFSAVCYRLKVEDNRNFTNKTTLSAFQDL